MFSYSEDEILLDNDALRELIAMGCLDRIYSVYFLVLVQYHTLFFKLASILIGTIPAITWSVAVGAVR